MRSLLIIGMALALLLVGILVMKNMGVDSRSGVTEVQTEMVIEQAQSIADEANQRTEALREQMSKAQ